MIRTIDHMFGGMKEKFSTVGRLISFYLLARKLTYQEFSSQIESRVSGKLL